MITVSCFLGQFRFDLFCLFPFKGALGGLNIFDELDRVASPESVGRQPASCRDVGVGCDNDSK